MQLKASRKLVKMSIMILWSVAETFKYALLIIVNFGWINCRFIYARVHARGQILGLHIRRASGRSSDQTFILERGEKKGDWIFCLTLLSVSVL